MKLPGKTYMSGWPDFLTDTQGEQYVRLRDGKPVNEYTGEVCLYGLLEKGYVSRQAQYVPVIDATLESMVLSGGTWMTAQQLEAQGQTPIVVPEEPIEVPPDDDEDEDKPERPKEEGEPEDDDDGDKEEGLGGGRAPFFRR